MRVTTPYSSFTPLSRFLTKEYTLPISAYADVKGEELELFIGKRKLEHFNIASTADSISNIAQKAQNISGQVQTFIAQSNLGTQPSYSYQQVTATQPEPAPENNGNSKTLWIAGGVVIVLVAIILIIKASK